MNIIMYRDNNMETTTILPIYHKCDVCNYTSILKANYDRHCMTRKHLKNIEKYNEKIEEEAEKDLENEGGGFSPPQHESDDDEGNIEPVKNINIQPDGGDIFYATKIYNTLFELKRQYPNKYEFVRNTDRMKREWKRWSQEQFDNDYVYCYTKWFGKISKVNNELVSKFVF
jgi:hypothetical protein